MTNEYLLESKRTIGTYEHTIKEGGENVPIKKLIEIGVFGSLKKYIHLNTETLNENARIKNIEIKVKEATA